MPSHLQLCLVFSLRSNINNLLSEQTRKRCFTLFEIESTILGEQNYQGLLCTKSPHLQKWKHLWVPSVRRRPPLSTVLSILIIVKHRLHVRNLRARCGPERRESWPRQYSLPFIAAINRHYDYHTQYVDIFTKWGARFISKYQNRPLPSTSCYFSRLSNVLIPRPVSCMVIVVSVGLPGVQGFYRFYTHPFIYYLCTYIYIQIAHFNQVYILRALQD